MHALASRPPPCFTPSAAIQGPPQLQDCEGGACWLRVSGALGMLAACAWCAGHAGCVSLQRRACSHPALQCSVSSLPHSTHCLPTTSAPRPQGVSFLGQHDEFVMSGSDCGHVYIWDRATGAVQAMLKVGAAWEGAGLRTPASLPEGQHPWPHAACGACWAAHHCEPPCVPPDCCASPSAAATPAPLAAPRRRATPTPSTAWSRTRTTC